jgi:hypothetical protein
VIHGWEEFAMAELVLSTPLLPAEPLYKRAPSHDEHGRALSDFMVLIPGLVQQPQHLIEAAIRHIQAVLEEFSNAVVFADLNLKLNLLWVSIRPVPRVRFAITERLREQIPQALLVSHL